MSKIQELARVIDREHSEQCDAANSQIEGFEDYRKIALALVASMREPSAEMVQAGRKSSGFLMDGSANSGGPRWIEAQPEAVAKVYRAMIDALLAEEP